VTQPEHERGNAALPALEETAERFEQGFERHHQPLDLADLDHRFEARVETLCTSIAATDFGCASGSAIEFLEQVHTETPGPAIARQAQAITHRTQAHRGK